MSKFRPRDFFRAEDMGEVTQLLSKYGSRARVIAGGTDLLVSQPPGVECLVDISSLKLSYVRKEDDGINVGAATPLVSLEDSSILSTDPYRVVPEAVNQLATPTIRNMATVGGNLCNASPAADLAVVLMVLDARVKVFGTRGCRELPIGEFFKDVKRTAMMEDELLVEVHIPQGAGKSAAAFQKLRHHQTSIDLAIVNVATRLSCSGDICQEARIALGAVANTPIYARRAEEVLSGKKMDAGLVEKAGEVAAQESRPIDDVRASGNYRRRMVAVLVRRALEESARRCGLWPE